MSLPSIHISRISRLYGFAVAWGCIVALLLLSHCEPLPICFQDRDCAPLSCVQGQCISPVLESVLEPVPTEPVQERQRLDDDAGPLQELVVEQATPDAQEFVGGQEAIQDAAPGERGAENIPEQAAESIPEQVVEVAPDVAVWDEWRRCQGEWVSSTTDPLHCGGCGRACGQGLSCCGGVCGKGVAEICNGKDDDCDGTIDEDTRDCVVTFAGVNLALDGPALWTPLSGPVGLATDAAGNLYIAERNQFRVRKLDPSGILTTVAGNGLRALNLPTGTFPARSVSLQGPTYLALDQPGGGAASTLYLSQNRNVDVVAISLPPQGGPPTLFRHLPGPFGVSGVAFDPILRQLYITLAVGSQIYRYEPLKQTSALFAGAGGSGGRNGPALQATFSSPSAMAFDGGGLLRIVDHRGAVIRQIDTQKIVSTIAGSHILGKQDGPALQATFGELRQIVHSANNELYMVDSANHRIRKLDRNGVVSTVVGLSSGLVDGPLQSARFSWPSGIAFDPQGQMYIADSGNHLIRKLDLAGQVTTVAGAKSYRKGPLFQAHLRGPGGLAFRQDGTMLVADTDNHRILRFDPQSKRFSTVAGSQFWLFSSDAFANDFGGERLLSPTAIALDSKDQLAIVERQAHRILSLDSNGKASFWGGIMPGRVDGSPQTARFREPQAIAFDVADRLYIADTENHAIRMIDTQKMVSTLAGTGKAGFLDGDGTKALFRQPAGIAVDGVRGRLYIADTGNHRIRVLDLTTRVVSTLVGSSSGFQDGTTAVALFASPVGLALDASGQLYVADRDNHCIRKIELDAAGQAKVVSTLIGVGTAGMEGGKPLASRLSQPTALRWGPDGRLYISDTGNHFIRVYVP